MNVNNALLTANSKLYFQKKIKTNSIFKKHLLSKFI